MLRNRKAVLAWTVIAAEFAIILFLAYHVIDQAIWIDDLTQEIQRLDPERT